MRNETACRVSRVACRTAWVVEELVGRGMTEGRMRNEE